MSDTVVITEYLGMKTGQGAKGPWVLHKAKDSLGRNLSAFGNVGQLLYDNVGKQVIVEGSARKPEYPNDITVTSLVATGEMPPVQQAPAPVAYSPPMEGDKDRRISMLAIAKSTLEGGDIVKALLSAGTKTELGPNETWTPDKVITYLADCAVKMADQVTNKISRPVVGAVAGKELVEDSDVPF